MSLSDNIELGEPLLGLVEQCEHLQEMTIWAKLHIGTVEKLLKIRLEKRVLLNRIQVRIIEQHTM